MRAQSSFRLLRDGGEREVLEELLSEELGEVRRRLNLDRPAPAPTRSDVLLFLCWAGLAASSLLAPLIIAAVLASALLLMR